MEAGGLVAVRDTIVAVATPPGRGGVGVVRLSGPRAREIAGPILRGEHGFEAGRARFARVLDPTRVGGGEAAVLDEAVVTFFAGPHSYTGDDVVEISMHGSPVLLEAVLRYVTGAGARLAEPGEFTQRAFLVGKLDLPGAEAVRDLIDAGTLHQARVASAQLGGSIGRAVGPVKRELVTLIAALEAGIDFAEDDLETMEAAEVVRRVEAARAPLLEMGAGFALGRATREGFRVALVGQPNAGKSSLFNRLLRRDRAIVTPQPGTTRDTVHEPFQVAGVPVELVDTAGLRELPEGAGHEAELAGIAKTRAMIAEAHHVLLVVDGTTIDAAAPVLGGEDATVAESLEGRPWTLAVNKADLLPGEAKRVLEGALPGAVLVSAVSGEGMGELVAALERGLGAGGGSAEVTLVTNVRQQGAILRASEALGHGAEAAEAGVPYEMVLLDLYGALRALDELTGDTLPESILQEIFATFCIGK